MMKDMIIVFQVGLILIGNLPGWKLEGFFFFPFIDFIIMGDLPNDERYDNCFSSWSNSHR
jgi:hypothetical protein